MIETVLLKIFGGIHHRGLQFAPDPLIRQAISIFAGVIEALRVHKDITRRVPQFVAEISKPLHTSEVEFNVATG